MSPVILGTVAAGLHLICQLDRAIAPGRRERAGLLAAGLAGGGLLRWMLGPGDFLSRLLLALVLGCLLLACVTDLAICQVYDFVWWLGSAAAAGLLWKRLWMTGESGESVEVLFELTVFCVVQLAVFGRLYGKADCYAFCVCTVAEAGLGMGAELFVVHMLLAFALLVPVQVIDRNLASGGNLKKPVPFIPYITASFYLLLFFVKICGETVVPLS